MQLDKLTDSVKLNLILKTKDACPMFWMKIYKKTILVSLNMMKTWHAAVLLASGVAQCWMSLEQMAEVRPASERQGWPEVMAGRLRRMAVVKNAFKTYNRSLDVRNILIL